MHYLSILPKVYEDVELGSSGGGACGPFAGARELGAEEDSMRAKTNRKRSIFIYEIVPFSFHDVYV